MTDGTHSSSSLSSPLFFFLCTSAWREQSTQRSSGPHSCARGLGLLARLCAGGPRLLVWLGGAPMRSSEESRGRSHGGAARPCGSGRRATGARATRGEPRRHREGGPCREVSPERGLPSSAPGRGRRWSFTAAYPPGGEPCAQGLVGRPDLCRPRRQKVEG